MTLKHFSNFIVEEQLVAIKRFSIYIAQKRLKTAKCF